LDKEISHQQHITTSEHHSNPLIPRAKTDNALFSQHKQTINAISTALLFNLQITLRSIVWTLTGLTGHWRSFLRARICYRPSVCK